MEGPDQSYLFFCQESGCKSRRREIFWEAFEGPFTLVIKSKTMLFVAFVFAQECKNVPLLVFNRSLKGKHFSLLLTRYLHMAMSPFLYIMFST